MINLSVIFKCQSPCKEYFSFENYVNEKSHLKNSSWKITVEFLIQKWLQNFDGPLLFPWNGQMDEIQHSSPHKMYQTLVQAEVYLFPIRDAIFQPNEWSNQLLLNIEAKV